MELGRVGFDFDGVLNKLPTPFRIFMRHVEPNDIWSKMTRIRTILFSIILCLPVILNGELIDDLPRNVFIISGRPTRFSKIDAKLRRLGFKNIYFRGNNNVSETAFKIEMCKKFDIDIFVEDRLYVIRRLEVNGIIGVDVREWAKRLVLWAIGFHI